MKPRQELRIATLNSEGHNTAASFVHCVPGWLLRTAETPSTRVQSLF